MRHQLMFLTPISDSDYADTVDDKPYVFEFEATENIMDADDPETALHDYLNRIFRTT
jgi:hypothetical protein